MNVKYCLGNKALGPEPIWENSFKIYIKENTVDCCEHDSPAEIYGPILGCCEKIMPMSCL